VYTDNNPLTGIDPEGLGFRDWYMGGMGGASDWVDRHLLGGQTAAFASATGRYDARAASGWEVAGQACLWGGGVAAAATTATGLGVGASRLPTAIARARTQSVAGLVRGVTKGAVGLDLGGAAHPLSRRFLTRACVPKREAGRLSQAQKAVPHINLGGVHVIVNRYNWYRPWRWLVKVK